MELMMSQTIAHPMLNDIDVTNTKGIRNLLGQFATGVTVITTRGKDGRKIGMTANSFSSLSLDPPLVLWSLSKTAPSLPDFVDATHFAIHMLGQEHHDISGHFARPAEDKFLGVAHIEHEDLHKTPLLADALATLVCRNVQQYEGGDHLIFIGEMQQYQQREGAPLVFHAGKYRAVIEHPELS